LGTFRNARLLRGLDVERRVLHAERPQDALLQEHIERLAADTLDHVAEHIGRTTVFPR
jgi:hypothetical protein